MNLETFIVFLMTFISWGLSSFISKMATNRIGEKSVFFGYDRLFFHSNNLFFNRF